MGAGAYHSGGLVGDFAGQRRYVPAALFETAPRAHRGLGPDEMPIVARRGEGVFTPRQMDNADAILRGALAGGKGAGDVQVQVVINDQRSGNAAPVKVKQGVGPGGMRQVEIVIRDTVRKGIVNGDYDTAAKQSWGVSRRGSS
jgi:hypothetical protein